LGGADADTQAIDQSANDEHADVLGGADDDGADNPRTLLVCRSMTNSRFSNVPND